MVYDQLGFPNPATAWVDESDQLDITYLYPDVVSGGAVFICTAYTLPAGETIQNVRLWIRHQEPKVGARQPTTAPSIYIAPLFYNGTAFQNTAITNDFYDWPQNPATLTTWTAADINSTDFGFLGATNRLTPDPITYEVWIEVTSAAAGTDGKAFIGSNFYLTLPVGALKQKPNKLRTLRTFRARTLV